MTVPEVADYLRLSERKVYDLVRTQRIPTCRIDRGGKILFPRRLIELWVVQTADYPKKATRLTIPPPVVAGSDDPLLEWAVRESKCELSILVEGSHSGILRLLHGQAVACAAHLIDEESGTYDAQAIARQLPGLDFVIIEWARRQQGLVVDRNHRKKITSIRDLVAPGVRTAVRQEGSGSAQLLKKLAADAGIDIAHLTSIGAPRTSETDVAVAIREGEADAGLAIEAVARDKGMHFVPLIWERFDLIVRPMEFFEPPLQRLFAFIRTVDFRARAKALGGYDVSNTGNVVFSSR
jgi:excisionase family DNA binding protein